MKRKFRIYKEGTRHGKWYLQHPLGGTILCGTFSSAILCMHAYADQLRLRENDKVPRTQDNQNPDV